MNNRKKLARQCIINWAASVIAYRQFYELGGDVTFSFACDGREARVQASKILKALCKDALLKSQSVLAEPPK